MAGMTLLIAVSGFAQAPFYHTFRPSFAGMRSAGLADASNADATDVTAMAANPACLSFLKYRSVALAHVTDIATQAGFEQASGVLPRIGELTFAVNAAVMHGGKLDPGEGVRAAWSGYGGDVGASYLLMPTMSVGVVAGARAITISGERRTTGWGLAGVFYYPSPGISYGLTYGAVRGITWWYANAQSGVIWEPDLTQHLEIGASMSYPPRAQDPVVTLSLATQRFFPGVSLFSTKGGLEVNPVPWIALRVGFKAGSVERVARYGIGIRMPRVRLDFALAPSAVENRFGGFSLMVDL